MIAVAAAPSLPSSSTLDIIDIFDTVMVEDIEHSLLWIEPEHGLVQHFIHPETLVSDASVVSWQRHSNIYQDYNDENNKWRQWSHLAEAFLVSSSQAATPPCAEPFTPNMTSNFSLVFQKVLKSLTTTQRNAWYHFSNVNDQKQSSPSSRSDPLGKPALPTSNLGRSSLTLSRTRLKPSPTKTSKVERFFFSKSVVW